MSRYAQLLAACGYDTHQADLVLDVLARRVHAPEVWCPTCLVDFDDHCCPVCGRIENNPARAAEPVRAARREPEKGA